MAATQTLTEKLQNDVLDLLRATCKNPRSGEIFQGESVSFLLSEIRGRGWKNIGSLNDFEGLVESAGFKVVHQAKIQSGGDGRWYNASVVTL